MNVRIPSGCPASAAGRRIIKGAVLIVCVLAAGPSQSPAQRPSSTGDLTAEELQIIAAALNETGLREVRRLAPGNRRDSPLAVVLDWTLARCGATRNRFCISERMHSTITRLLGGLHSPMAAAFTARNAVSSPVRSFAERMTLIPAGELETIFQPGRGWQEFRSRFGTAGLLQFSAPAIEGDQAAIHVVFGCGGLCGKSWLVTLERRRGEFRVRTSQILTIS